MIYFTLFGWTHWPVAVLQTSGAQHSVLEVQGPQVPSPLHAGVGFPQSPQLAQPFAGTSQPRVSAAPEKVKLLANIAPRVSTVLSSLISAFGA